MASSALCLTATGGQRDFRTPGVLDRPLLPGRTEQRAIYHARRGRRGAAGGERPAGVPRSASGQRPGASAKRERPAADRRGAPAGSASAGPQGGRRGAPAGAAGGARPAWEPGGSGRRGSQAGAAGVGSPGGSGRRGSQAGAAGVGAQAGAAGGKAPAGSNGSARERQRAERQRAERQRAECQRAQRQRGAPRTAAAGRAIPPAGRGSARAPPFRRLLLGAWLAAVAGFAGGLLVVVRRPALGAHPDRGRLRLGLDHRQLDVILV